MPRRREEEDHDLPPEESSVTQYDSPSDSTQGSEHSSQSGHTTHSTSLHSGRSRRLAAPVPVHAQGLYRADGMAYHPLNGSRAAPEAGAPLRRAPSVRSVRGMYDPEIHDAPPPPPPPRGKEAVSTPHGACVWGGLKQSHQLREEIKWAFGTDRPSKRIPVVDPFIMHFDYCR